MVVVALVVGMEVMEEDKVRSHRTVLPPVEVVEDPYPRTDRPFLSAEALRITLLLALHSALVLLSL